MVQENNLKMVRRSLEYALMHESVEDIKVEVRSAIAYLDADEKEETPIKNETTKQFIDKWLGTRVLVVGDNSFKGEEGIVVDIHLGVIPIGVRLDNSKNTVTDFAPKELKIINKEKGVKIVIELIGKPMQLCADWIAEDLRIHFCKHADSNPLNIPFKDFNTRVVIE